MVNYRTVLELKFKNVNWSLANDNAYDTLKWPNENKPSQELLDTLVQDEIRSRKILNLDKRKSEYPDLAEQLDMLWHAMNDGLLPNDNKFYEAIKAVKDNNPKPE